MGRKKKTDTTPPKKKSEVQADYRAKRKAEGRQQVVIYLEQDLADRLKAEAKENGTTRSALIESCLQGSAGTAATSYEIPSPDNTPWPPPWLPDELANQLEKEAKGEGIPPQQLAAERLALAGRTKDKPHKIKSRGKGEASAPVRVLEEEANRLQDLGGQLLADSSRHLGEAPFAGNLLRKMAREIQYGLPILSRRPKRLRRKPVYRAWVRTHEAKPGRAETYLVVAENEKAAAALLKVTIGELRKNWSSGDFRLLGEDVAMSGIRLAAGAYPGHSDAWWKTPSPYERGLYGGPPQFSEDGAIASPGPQKTSV